MCIDRITNWKGLEPWQPMRALGPCQEKSAGNLIKPLMLCANHCTLIFFLI